MGNPGSAAGFVGSVFYLQDPSSTEDAESFTDGASRLSEDVSVLLTVLSSSGDRAVVLSVDLVVLLLKDSLPVYNTHVTIGMSADELHTLVGFSQKGLTNLQNQYLLSRIFENF